MNFAYLPDWTVTGYGRGAEEGTEEITGTCTPQDWNVLPQEYNKDVRCYTAPNGILTAKSQADVDSIIAKDEKDKAYASQVDSIEGKKDEENDKPFLYNEYTYKVDDGGKEDIQAYQGLCITLQPTDPIPTFPQTETLAGKWLNFEEVPVSFTCAEFIELANAIIARSTWNFDTRLQHQMALRAMYADDTKTAEDILGYDFSTGWN